MRSREIPRDQWGQFLDNFSRRHQGDRVGIELLGQDIGHQYAAGNMPLLGIANEIEPNGEEIIEVIAAEAPNQNITHTIHNPSHIWLATAEDGREEVLEIEAEGEPKTLVRLEESIADS